MRKCTGLPWLWARFAFIRACSRGARFLGWSYVHSMRKSKDENNSTIFHWLLSQNAGKIGILEAHILTFFPGQHAPGPLEAHACGDHGHGYAGPKTAFFQFSSFTGLETLKVEFFNYKLMRNNFSCFRSGAFLLFPARRVGNLSLFARY